MQMVLPNNLLFLKSEANFMCFFMNDICSESHIVVTVTDKSTLCSPLTFSAFKNGIKVNIPKTIINPNNGIDRYSQYFEAINFVVQHQVPLEPMLEKNS